MKLVNLSRGGALVESPARYPMRSAIQLAVTRPSGDVTAKTANVSWAQVASVVDMRISYLLAFTFDTPPAVREKGQRPPDHRPRPGAA